HENVDPLARDRALTKQHRLRDRPNEPGSRLISHMIQVVTPETIPEHHPEPVTSARLNIGERRPRARIRRRGRLAIHHQRALTSTTNPRETLGHLRRELRPARCALTARLTRSEERRVGKEWRRQVS